MVPYYGSSTGAFAEGGFQDSNAVLIDVTMPYTGTYYVKVSTYSVTDSFGILHNSEVGNYELFMYSFAATHPAPRLPARQHLTPRLRALCRPQMAIRWSAALATTPSWAARRTT